ncbi:MAG: HAD-IC family P-type ATPase, partial [Microthrixaceae bacterium]|nr:HAD-IC family P-type ATPase [Microthrixaceae bacterium]
AAGRLMPRRASAPLVWPPRRPSQPDCFHRRAIHDRPAMKTYSLYGFYTALASMVLTLAIYFLGYHSDPAKFSTGQIIGSVGGLAIGITFIVLGTKARRAEWPVAEDFTYGNAFVAGFMTMFCAGVIGIVTNYLYFQVINPGIAERFAQLRAMGIKTVMITGDNPVTARVIAAEAGVDDFLAEATPEMKMDLIKAEQAGSRLVAMTGDGTNDAPALAQADVGVAMNTGTQAAKEAGNMVDLDSDPTKLLDIVEIGKQLLITRGALTTFSIANDVAKYFAIIPAMFAGVLPALDRLNVMGLQSPNSAILSAVIFNALIIVVLIPLALRGVKFVPSSAAALLRRNLLVYGLGGLLAPFVGIKLIDMLLTAFGVQ